MYLCRVYAIISFCISLSTPVESRLGSRYILIKYIPVHLSEKISGEHELLEMNFDSANVAMVRVTHFHQWPLPEPENHR